MRRCESILCILGTKIRVFSKISFNFTPISYTTKFCKPIFVFLGGSKILTIHCLFFSLFGPQQLHFSVQK